MPSKNGCWSSILNFQARKRVNRIGREEARATKSRPTINVSCMFEDSTYICRPVFVKFQRLPTGRPYMCNI